MTDGTPETARLAAVAERAVRAGGTYLAGAFREGPIDADYGPDDVKAAADRAAEDRVLAVIREAYPDHAVHAEESGITGDHRYEWVVDPLDGTNNFAAGKPSGPGGSSGGSGRDDDASRERRAAQRTWPVATRERRQTATRSRPTPGCHCRRGRCPSSSGSPPFATRRSGRPPTGSSRRSVPSASAF